MKILFLETFIWFYIFTISVFIISLCELKSSSNHIFHSEILSFILLVGQLAALFIWKCLYFSFIFEGGFCWVENFWLGVFFPFSTLNMSSSALPPLFQMRSQPWLYHLVSCPFLLLLSIQYFLFPFGFNSLNILCV